MIVDFNLSIKSGIIFKTIFTDIAYIIDAIYLGIRNNSLIDTLRIGIYRTFFYRSAFTLLLLPGEELFTTIGKTILLTSRDWRMIDRRRINILFLVVGAF